MGGVARARRNSSSRRLSLSALSEGLVMTAPNNRVEATQQMFTAVGRAISQWSFVEERLFGLFCVCVGTVVPLPGKGIQYVDSWVPTWVFYSMDTFHAKRTMLDAAVTAYLHDISQQDELTEKWGKLSQKGRELANRRNKLAHWFVLPAQPRGSGAPEEGFSPARLMPPIGSPGYWRETGYMPKRKSLTAVQVGHLEKAFCLYGDKVHAFTRKLTENQELRDKDAQQAARLLLMDGRLTPNAQEELTHLLAFQG
jgi:hypothetical protein